MKTLSLILVLLLSGCACTQDMTESTAVHAAFGNDPVTMLADVVIEASVCEAGNLR